MPHEISRVEPGSIADQLGIRPGDVLQEINGRHPVDLIDYEAFCCVEKMRLLLKRGDEELEFGFTKDEYEPLGLGFDRPLMSRQRDCANQCLFCFVDQLPGDARSTLRVKDDDWRMSLMMGNFVTLTNVSDAELDRIIARRASPLYISVHAVNPQLRAQLLGQPLGAKIMDQLRRLAVAGISFHAQAVLCPGFNDGAELERTVRELSGLYPACLSLALVPVGLTGHRDGLCPLRPFAAADAGRVLEAVEGWRATFKKELGEAFVHPADEFYLIAGRDFPPDADYEDYPQIENGVGLCRLLETEYRAAWEESDFSGVRPANLAIACGVLVAPFLRKVLSDMPVPGAQIQVHAVENHFFGPSVTVSGLLTGQDLIRAMKGIASDKLLITQSMLREGDDTFLDGMRLCAVEAALGRKIQTVSGGEALFQALCGMDIGG